MTDKMITNNCVDGDNNRHKKLHETVWTQIKICVWVSNRIFMCLFHFFFFSVVVVVFIVVVVLHFSHFAFVDCVACDTITNIRSQICLISLTKRLWWLTYYAHICNGLRKHYTCMHSYHIIYTCLRRVMNSKFHPTNKNNVSIKM